MIDEEGEQQPDFDAIRDQPVGHRRPQPNLTMLDVYSEAAHQAWLAEKIKRLEALGVPITWPSEDGTEQLVDWADLGESVREFDRIVVRAIIKSIWGETS